MPDKRYNGRRQEIYFPSIQDLQRWRSQAKKYHVPRSKWIYQFVESHLDLDQDPDKISAASEDILKLQTEVNRLRTELKDKSVRLERVETDLFNLRYQPFMDPDPESAKFSRELITLLKAGGDQVQNIYGDCIIIPAGASYDRRIARHPSYTNSYNFVHINFETGKGIVFLRRWSESRKEWVEDVDAYPRGEFPINIPKFEPPKGLREPPKNKILFKKPHRQAKLKPSNIEKCRNIWRLKLAVEGILGYYVNLIPDNLNFIMPKICFYLPFIDDSTAIRIRALLKKDLKALNKSKKLFSGLDLQLRKLIETYEASLVDIEKSIDKTKPSCPMGHP